MSSAALPILYSFRRCPYAMRARMALVAAGQTVELREVSLKAKPEALIAASSKATVPVLVLRDGTVVDESLDIMRWALTQADPESWLKPGTAMDPLIAANDGPFKYHLDRAKYPGRFEEGAAADHRAAAVALLRPLEARLLERSYLFGKSVCLADVALFPFIRQFSRIDGAGLSNDALPQIERWLSAWEACPLFGRVMAKTPLWQDGTSGKIFP